MMTAKAVKVGKGYKGPIGMDGLIARWYARLTQKNMQDYINDAKRMTQYLASGDAVLEVAPGPGFLSIALARLGSYRITGLDISQTFVDIAGERAREAGVPVDFQHGNAADMPFEANSFNLIVCRAAYTNFAEPVAALNEMHRVLKPGGKAVIIDLRGDASQADIDREVDKMHLNAVNALMTRWTFKHSLLKRAYTADSFSQLIAQSNFEKHDIRTDAIGMEIILEK